MSRPPDAEESCSRPLALFASLLAYQLVDLLFAVGVVAVALRLARSDALLRRVAARRAFSTPFRRVALLGTPLFVGLMAVAVAIGELLFPAIDHHAHGFPNVQRAANVGGFLLLGVAYYGLFVVLPVVGVWSAARERATPGDATSVARRRVDRRLATVALLLAGATLWYSSFFEPNRLVVERRHVALAEWPKNRPPLRVVLVSDVQAARLGDRERRLCELVASLHPDVVVVAGDLIAQSFDESLPLEQAHWTLSHLEARLGVFVVNGDVDESVEGGIERLVRGTPAHWLDNESIVLPTDPPVELAGFDPRDPARYAAALARPPKAAIRVAAVHRPRHYVEIGKAGYPLVLAGHTHGGQVVVPGFGPPVTLEVVPRDVAAGGLHRMPNGVQLEVTRGVGHEGGYAPRIRFLCPPEVTLLEIGDHADAAD
jgi:predicted MPP superfamily phosphohydrolase